jgi:Restriction endonuclease
MREAQWTDQALESKIQRLRTAIEEWLREKELTVDCGFTSWLEHFDDEPEETPCVLLLWHENHLTDSTDLLSELALEVVQPLGFLSEPITHTLIGFYVDEDDWLRHAYRSYYEWKWLLRLIESSYYGLYGEIFEYTSRNPDKLYDLTPRAFETFLDAVFKNNGFRSILGPGTGDRGIDLRLYSNDVVGEITTLVQAKRYRKDLPIDLEAVQALAGAVDDYRANRGLFVTTSRYLRSARAFAARQRRKLILAESSDIACWAAQAHISVERDKAQWVSRSHALARLALARNAPSSGLIFIAQTGVTMCMHEYALLLHEVGDVALFVRLPSFEVSGDGLQGTDLPLLEANALADISSETVFRARKMKGEGRNQYWGNLHLWSAHDGTPQWFDYLD